MISGSKPATRTQHTMYVACICLPQNVLMRHHPVFTLSLRYCWLAVWLIQPVLESIGVTRPAIREERARVFSLVSWRRKADTCPDTCVDTDIPREGVLATVDSVVRPQFVVGWPKDRKGHNGISDAWLRVIDKRDCGAGRGRRSCFSLGVGCARCSRSEVFGGRRWPTKQRHPAKSHPAAQLSLPEISLL